MPETTLPAEDMSQVHEFQQLPDVSVRVCYCGKWPDHDIHTRAEGTDEPEWQTAYRLRQRLAAAEHDLAAMTIERDRYRTALRPAQEALIHADRLCRYHGDTPPEHPTWHGGCDSCKQPTRVRAALDAIDAAQRAALDTQETP